MFIIQTALWQSGNQKVGCAFGGATVTGSNCCG
jgi:hypothetical protein